MASRKCGTRSTLPMFDSLCNSPLEMHAVIIDAEDTMNNKDMIIKILMETSRLLQTNSWNKFSMARDANGDRCGPESSDAICYCLSGALVKTWRTLDRSREEFYFKYFENKFSEVLAEKYNYPYTYTLWNDRVATRKEDVLELIHSVIVSIIGSDANLDLESEKLLHIRMNREPAKLEAMAARGQYAPA